MSGAVSSLTSRLSLQATWIRNTILRVVREQFPDATKRLPTNLVFQAPSVSTLADAVLRAVHDSEDRSTATVTEENLVQLAEKYSSNLPSRPPSLRSRNSGKDIIAITGTTGGFGCDILHHLLLDDEIGMVYAFNRKGSNAIDRQRARFLERGLDENLLESHKFKMVEAELDTPGLGVDSAILDEVSNQPTQPTHALVSQLYLLIALHRFASPSRTSCSTVGHRVVVSSSDESL